LIALTAWNDARRCRALIVCSVGVVLVKGSAMFVYFLDALTAIVFLILTHGPVIRM
jgi:hypothetical protein